MIVVIDGYNILKLIHGPDITQTQRSAFINLLGRYLKKRNHKVVIVFDAGPCTYQMQEKQRGVAIIYSGEYLSADDSIVKFCKEHAQKEVVVISADRGLIQRITQYGADVVEPLVFYEKVRDVCDASEAAAKNSGDVSVQKFEYDGEVQDSVDELMYEAASMKVPFKDDIAPSERCKKNELSKKNKQRLRTVDKL